MNKPIIMMVLLPFTIMALALMSRQQHILPVLLSLEGLMLLLILYLLYVSNIMLMHMNPITIIMLTMSVSGASIGLTVMIMVSRKTGNDSIMGHVMPMC